MKKNQNAGSQPVAFIAKNKQRVKQYDDIVYLKNGDEFQIELFNPTQTKVLAKIEMDGKSIGNGIILRPGERVFLERYVNDARKFKFDTYEVEGNNKQVMKAIENNGSVNVKFYKEQLNDEYWNGLASSSSIYTYPQFTYTQPNIRPNIFASSNLIGTSFYSNTGPDLNVRGTLSYTCTAASGEPSINDMDIKGRSLSKSIIETGRVEKGSYSDQTFAPDYTKFESSYQWASEWTILPESRKPITADDLVVYCASCGRRRRSNENYCPSCGYKF